jgi:hypothetical protein
VRTHARAIYRKLGISSRRDLARLARQDPVVVDEERRVSGRVGHAEQPAHVE